MLGGGSGAGGISRSFLAGAFKASGLTSCREVLACQDHLPMSPLARQLVTLRPSLWHHARHAPCWGVGGWSPLGSGPVSDLLTGPGSTWRYPGVQFTPKMRKGACGEKPVGSEGAWVGVRFSLAREMGVCSTPVPTKDGGRSPLVLRTSGQVAGLYLTQMCTSVT